MTLRNCLLAVGLFAGSLSAAWAARDPAPDLAGVASLAPPAPGRNVGGELEVVRVESTPAGDRLVLEAHLTSVLGKSRGLYALEVVDDLGQPRIPVQELRLSPPSRSADLEGFTLRHTLDPLPNGYFVVRLTAAMAGEKGREGLIRRLYLRVQGGGVDVISADEFHTESRISVGRLAQVGGAQ